MGLEVLQIPYNVEWYFLKMRKYMGESVVPKVKHYSNTYLILADLCSNPGAVEISQGLIVSLCSNLPRDVSHNDHPL